MPRDTIQPPCVLAIDIGTSSVRAILYDRRGRITDRSVQQAYSMDTSPDGGVFIDADRLVEAAGAVLDRFVKEDDRPDVAAWPWRPSGTTWWACEETGP